MRWLVALVLLTAAAIVPAIASLSQISAAGGARPRYGVAEVSAAGDGTISVVSDTSDLGRTPARPWILPLSSDVAADM